VLAAGVGVGASAMNAAHHEHADGEKVRELSATDIREKLDGKDARATVVEVTIQPVQAGVPHRHPGPAFVYVLEGEWETGIDDQPTKVIKAGETFYEPGGCVHRVSRNPGKTRTRLLAWVLHPRDAKDIAIPVKK
jgi:quercetin dioxygenase-like cupin family protein